MSPIDDELRATLQARALELTPSPDPLAGIESRARGIKRRRVAASITGAALAVAAIAVAVPSLTSSTSGSKVVQQATSGPTAGPSYALDPAKPWSYRGEPPSEGDLKLFQSAWDAKHPGSLLIPLFAQIYEPSQQAEVVFVASGPDGPRYGLASGSDSNISFVYDEPLAPSTKVLAFALEGDEVPRLLAVAAPGVSRFELAPDGDGGSFVPMTAIADGVATIALEGALDRDYLRVTAPDGTVLFQGEAPGGSGPLPTDAPTAGQPTNVVGWPTRGAGESDLLPAARKAIAPTLGATSDTVELKILFAGDTDSGVKYLMGQAWKRGSATAYPFSYAEGGTNGPAPFVGKANTKNPALLAFVLSDLPGTSVEQLVVIPVPRTAQVSYDDNASGSFRAISGQDHLDGVVLIDRAIGETDDRLELLDGNGDLDKPTYRGPVAPFLCGMKECG